MPLLSRAVVSFVKSLIIPYGTSEIARKWQITASRELNMTPKESTKQNWTLKKV